MYQLDTFSGETQKEIQSMMDAYACDYLETERARIFSVLERLRNSDEWTTLTIDDLAKIILGNKK